MPEETDKSENKKKVIVREKEGNLKSAENSNISRLTWFEVQHERCQSETQITKSR
jgi:hypothetical protein